MNRDQLKRLLHTQADRYEAEYRGRPLPLTFDRPHGGRPNVLPMIVSAAGGAVVALALVAVTGSAVFGLFREANAGLSPEASERQCRSADFTIRAEPWPNAPMAGGVLVIFQANEGAWCHINHGIYTIVRDANGANGVEVAQVLREAIPVAPGMTWQSGVYWSTYCGTAGGTVAAPEHPARPLQLSMAIAVPGEPLDGEPTITGDTLLPVATEAEIAPEPCADEQPGTPFWLGSTGLEPYPGPAPTVSGSS
jgi:hypothetical protein